MHQYATLMSWTMILSTREKKCANLCQSLVTLPCHYSKYESLQLIIFIVGLYTNTKEMKHSSSSPFWNFALILGTENSILSFLNTFTINSRNYKLTTLITISELVYLSCCTAVCCQSDLKNVLCLSYGTHWRRIYNSHLLNIFQTITNRCQEAKQIMI